MTIATNASACKPSDEEIVRVCSFLLKNNVQLAIPGMFFIGAEDILLHLSDPQELQAKLFGVTKQDLIDQYWIEYQCYGINKNGERCKNFAHPEFTNNPRGWVEAGKPLPMCRKHGGK
jgi:hypothetical protein